MKTEFMTQVDGATTSSEDRILIMAATNIPWELDEAVLRYVLDDFYYVLACFSIYYFFFVNNRPCNPGWSASSYSNLF